MAKANQTPKDQTEPNSASPSPTTDASVAKPLDTTTREGAKIYADAEQENYERNFIANIEAARAPQPAPVYVPPKPAPAILEQTRLEMEAGAKRVKEFEAEEVARKAAHEAHQRDKWADKGSTPVFRPVDYVPDQKKGQGNVNAVSNTG